MTSDPIFLFPREHGAYGQIAFPLATSFAVAGISLPAICLALCAIAGFLSHEPLLVLLGRRGVRARREQHRVATIGLIVTGTFATVTGIAAVLLTPAALRWSFLLPLVPAVLLAIAIGIGHEKRALGEVSVALAFSFVAVPLCLAAGAPLRAASSVAIVFAAIFVTATLAVRVVVLRVRGGGNPRAERATRAFVLLLACGFAAVLIWTALVGVMSWVAIAGAAPGLIGSVWLSLLPPSPTRLRDVGWTLVAASGAAAVMLIVGL